MNIKNLTAALAMLTLLTACNYGVKPSAQIVKWEVKNGQTFAVIDKRPGMQIAYITDANLLSPNAAHALGSQAGIGRILVAGNLSRNDAPIRLNKFPFVYKLPGKPPVQIACPNCVPCSSGDDCVPPVPPKLSQVIWPAAERLICSSGSAQYNDALLCGANCSAACSITPTIP